MLHKPRTPVERAGAAIERAIDRELPGLIPTDRRALWAAIRIHAMNRLREFDKSAEANLGASTEFDKYPRANEDDAIRAAEGEGMPPEIAPGL